MTDGAARKTTQLRRLIALPEPDGQRVAVRLDAFCKHAQWLLGLGRHLGRCRERLIEIICFPLRGQGTT